MTTPFRTPGRMMAALALVMAIGLVPAQAMEALALKVLGFSPDGRYFGFIQYGGQGDGGEYMAETYVIDTSRDRFVPGVPLRVDTVDDQGNADEAAAYEVMLKRALQRSHSLIQRFDVSKPGTVLARADDARTGEPHSGSGGPTAGAKSLTAKHPALGDLALKLDAKEFVWPKTSKTGAHKGAGSCAQEVDWQKGAGFRLTLEQGRRSVVLNDDKTVPASRFCASGYGIAEVHAYDRPDGKITLAVIIGMTVRGFEGDDRLFLAVTKVMDR